MEKVDGEQGLALQQNFHTNPLNFLKFKLSYKLSPLMPGASNLAIIVHCMCSFHFWHINFLKKFGHMTATAKGLLLVGKLSSPKMHNRSSGGYSGQHTVQKTSFPPAKRLKVVCRLR